MWWVDILWGDEWLVKYAGTFISEEVAESYAMMITGDSSNYHVWKEEE